MNKVILKKKSRSSRRGGAVKWVLCGDQAEGARLEGQGKERSELREVGARHRSTPRPLARGAHRPHHHLFLQNKNYGGDTLGPIQQEVLPPAFITSHILRLE